MREYVSKNIRRVTKTTARKLYENGVEVMFIPCNLHPENPYYKSGFWIDKSREECEDFDRVANMVAWYNCTTPEAGKYLAYYVKNEVA